MDEGGGGRPSSPEWDPSLLREEDFEDQAVYQVPDQPCEGLQPRAQASLPRNLVLKPSQALSDVSIALLPFPRVLALFRPICAGLLFYYERSRYEHIFHLVPGAWSLEHGLHSQGHQIWTPCR